MGGVGEGGGGVGGQTTQFCRWECSIVLKKDLELHMVGGKQYGYVNHPVLSEPT